MTTTTSAAPGAAQTADTYGWDTAFAIRFTNANKAIADSWSNQPASVQQFSQANSDDSTYNISGQFGAWQLTLNGDGKNVRMECPIQSGTYAFPNGSCSLANAAVVIEVGMEWVPEPGQVSFVVSGNDEITAITTEMNEGKISTDLAKEFANHDAPLGDSAKVTPAQPGREWSLINGSDTYYLFKTTSKNNDSFLTVYKFQANWTNNLVLLGDSVAAGDLAVDVRVILNNPASGIPAQLLPGIFSDWFNASIADFNYVFAALDLSPALDTKDNWQWIKPTATSYAVIDQGTMADSVFSVLTMVQGNVPGTNHQVSPYAIPDGADAGFLISGPTFMANMMLGGASTVFNNAPLSSFKITNDGLTITNTDPLVWGRFMSDNNELGITALDDYAAQLDAGTIPSGLVQVFFNFNKSLKYNEVQVTEPGKQWLLTNGKPDDDGYILHVDDNGVDLHIYAATKIDIPPGDFTMTLSHTTVQLQFINLNYSYCSEFNVHVNYTETLDLTLQDQDGRKILWFDNVQKDMTVNVTQTKAAITRQIVEGVIMTVVAMVAVAGPICEGLAAGAKIGTVTEEVGEGAITLRTFTQVAEEDPEATLADNAAAGTNAAAQSSGRLTNIKNAFSTTRWKTVGYIAATATAVAGADKTVSEVMASAAAGKWQDVPSFDGFADLAIAPYSWPGVPGYTLASAQLSDSLQIGLTVQQ